MKNLVKKSPELYLATSDIFVIGDKEIAFLKEAVNESALGRTRINVHLSSDDTLHEMFIAIKKDSYIRPHKHPGKSEAFHMVHGSARVVIFDDVGGIKDVVKLSSCANNGSIYYRMSNAYYHTLILDSEIVVVHEITNGPFIPGNTQFAPFAPTDNQDSDFQRYLNELDNKLIKWDQI